MRKIDRRIVIVFTLLVTIGLAYGVMRYLISLKDEPPFRPQSETRRFVQVDTVCYTTIMSPVEGDGRLASVAEVDVIAEASGKILPGLVPLKTGAVFSKGDALFEVYPDEAILALKAKKSQYLNSLANILPDLRIDYPEEERMFITFFKEIELDKPLPEFPKINNEKLKIFLATRNILSEYYSITKDELQLNRYTVKAPFSGTYKEVYLEVGAYTNMGGRVASMINTEELELEIPLKRFDAEWVKIGDQVKVHSNVRNMDWEGRVIRKSLFVDPEYLRQSVYIRLSSSTGNNVLAGEYLLATFPGHPIEGVMEIPRNAVFNSDEVFIVQEGRLARRIINVIKTNSNTLIMNGLDENALLVVQPLINVHEGILVDFEGNPDKPESGRPQQGSKEGMEGRSGGSNKKQGRK